MIFFVVEYTNEYNSRIITYYPTETEALRVKRRLEQRGISVCYHRQALA